MNGVALAVIPARLGSSRLPRKPLHPLADRPLIEWVWRRVAHMALFDRIVIATDSEEVAAAAGGFGAEVVLTAADHPSGTDRVAEVARLPAYAGYSVVVNVQGDEPFVRREAVAAALGGVTSGAWGVGTVATPVRSLREWRDPATVKVVRDDRGGALLFSRAPIPFARDADPTPGELAGDSFLRHIGIYAYRRESLLRWVELPEGQLERIERLEQLRPLAAGIGIGVAVLPATPDADDDRGVDTPDDAARAERRIRTQLSSGSPGMA